MAQFKRSSVTKMLIAEATRTTFANPKSEDQYEAQTYLTPTGRTVAKVIIVGTATEKEDIGKDSSSLWRMRVSDPSGSIGVMAGQYQPEAMQVMAQLEIPNFITIVGKLNIYEPEEGNKIVSIRPESVTVIDEETRNTLLLDTAISTIRSIRKTGAEESKEAERIYGHEYNQDGFLLVAKKTIESLLPIDKAGEGKATEPPKSPSPSPNKEPEKKVPEKPAKEPVPQKTAKEQKKEIPEKPAKEQKNETPEKPKAEKNSDIKSIHDVVMELLTEKKQIKYSDLPALLTKKGVNVKVIDWEGAVKNMMKEGYAYEPKLGILKAT